MVLVSAMTRPVKAQKEPIKIAIPKLDKSLYEETVLLAEAIQTYYKDNITAGTLEVHVIEQESRSEYFDWLEKKQVSSLSIINLSIPLCD
jgi:hypothetical protein